MVQSEPFATWLLLVFDAQLNVGDAFDTISAQVINETHIPQKWNAVY
jgi:hypothetical protein